MRTPAERHPSSAGAHGSYEARIQPSAPARALRLALTAASTARYNPQHQPERFGWRSWLYRSPERVEARRARRRRNAGAAWQHVRAGDGGRERGGKRTHGWRGAGGAATGGAVPAARQQVARWRGVRQTARAARWRRARSGAATGRAGRTERRARAAGRQTARVARWGRGDEGWAYCGKWAWSDCLPRAAGKRIRRRRPYGRRSSVWAEAVSDVPPAAASTGPRDGPGSRRCPFGLGGSAGRRCLRRI
ncbi:hypothetical protein BXY51_001790 [Actinoplanes cyaneus]|nr:hypothetical protein [Actinoplanes cyaneus]